MAEQALAETTHTVKNVYAVGSTSIYVWIEVDWSWHLWRHCSILPRARCHNYCAMDTTMPWFRPQHLTLARFPCKHQPILHVRLP